MTILEKDTDSVTLADKELVLVSIAISLKRIADQLSGDPQLYNLQDCLNAWHREMVR